MHQYYKDILDRIPEAPKWFDDAGVPRYAEFHPSDLNNIYTTEAALAEIACQECGRRFRVALSNRYADPGFSLSDEIRLHRVAYGDPPNVQCCIAGHCMTSEMVEILEYWRFSFRGDPWERVPTLERPISPRRLVPVDAGQEVLVSLHGGTRSVHVHCTSEPNRYAILGHVTRGLMPLGRILIAYAGNEASPTYPLSGKVLESNIGRHWEPQRKVVTSEFSHLHELDIGSFEHVIVLGLKEPISEIWQQQWESSREQLISSLGDRIWIELSLPNSHRMIPDPEVTIDASRVLAQPNE